MYKCYQKWHEILLPGSQSGSGSVIAVNEPLSYNTE